ncbi:MAG: hypothetical protein QM783_05315 [Phycisphaerales bacterium]
MPRTTLHRRAITLVETIIVLLVVAGIFVLILPQLACTRCSAPQIKCGTQVRNVIQAMTIFAQGNRDMYPLPSQLDVNNQTVAMGVAGDATTQRGKDTLDNMMSILVFNSSISPELLWSPSEVNGNIQVHQGYQNANPTAAVSPAKAVWDPSLRADFTTGVGHISYAALMSDGDPKAALDQPAAGRLRHWSNTFGATEAIFGNRGPLVTGRDAKGNILYDRKSNTMRIHGPKSTWEGNIGYNDNHVNFEAAMDPAEITYTIAGGTRPDIFFFDEPDNTDGLNANLGIWVQAGNKPSEFKGIHD